MLSVGIELVGPVEALVGGVAETEAQGATDTEVEGKAQAGHPGCSGDSGGVVRGAVVDDDDLMVGDGLRQLGEHAGQGLSLVECGHHDGGAHTATVSE